MAAIRRTPGSAPRQRGWFGRGQAVRGPEAVGPAPAGVVRHGPGRRACGPRRPRASGGGSGCGCHRTLVPESAPRQRGWFRIEDRSTRLTPVGPAPAGVVPRRRARPLRRPSRPRASGGGSFLADQPLPSSRSAPRQRGWFRYWGSQKPMEQVGPAPAGVVRTRSSRARCASCRPRASGGGSPRSSPCGSSVRSAPRQRGWFRGMASSGPFEVVGPAPAGVVRCACTSTRRTSGRPRASGGGSARHVLGRTSAMSAPRQRGWFLGPQERLPLPRVGPAPAGVVLPGPSSFFWLSCRPRASGGGSRPSMLARLMAGSAPRQRGWFGPARGGALLYAVGPAPAGVVPPHWSSASGRICRPRASGGGSSSPEPSSGSSSSAPRQRGWFLLEPRRQVFRLVGPAPAGVVLRRPLLECSSRRRPRASGGGSWRPPDYWPRSPSAPRQRGWFQVRGRDVELPEVGPAPAGVVPALATTQGACQCRPRASGGGSGRLSGGAPSAWSAPRQRGWFPRCLRRPGRPPVGPAPAGVVLP